MVSDINPSKHSFGALAKIMLSLLMAVLTFLIFQVISHFVAVESNIIPNLSFESGETYWGKSPVGVSLANKPLPVVEFTLAHPPKPLILGRVIPNPQRFSHIRVGADIKVDNVIPGDAWWERAGVILRSWDRQGRKIRFWPKTVAALSGTSDWIHYDSIIPVPDNAHLMQLLFFLDGRAGRMEVTNISLDAVTPSVWFDVAVKALIAGWVLLGLWVFAPLLYTARHRITACFALAAFLATLVAVLTPQPNLSNIAAKAISTTFSFVEPLRSTFSSTTPKTPPSEASSNNKDESSEGSGPSKKPSQKIKPSVPLSKEFTRYVGMTPREFAAGGGSSFSHIISHAAFSFFTVLAFPLAAPLLLGASLALAAVTTEMLQLFVVTRSTSMDDVIMNFLGVALGVLIAIATRFCLRRIQRGKSSGRPDNFEL